MSFGTQTTCWPYHLSHTRECFETNVRERERVIWLDLICSSDVLTSSCVYIHISRRICYEESSSGTPSSRFIRSPSRKQVGHPMLLLHVSSSQFIPCRTLAPEKKTLNADVMALSFHEMFYCHCALFFRVPTWGLVYILDLPPPSNSGKWRFMGIPYSKSKIPGGDWHPGFVRDRNLQIFYTLSTSLHWRFVSNFSFSRTQGNMVLFFDMPASPPGRLSPKAPSLSRPDENCGLMTSMVLFGNIHEIHIVKHLGHLDASDS